MDFYEAQAIQMRNVPGLSIADANFIDQWVERARADDRHHVARWVRERREQNRAKATQALGRINALQDQLVEVRKKAERNEVAWTDLAKVQRRLRTERVTLEKVLESLNTSEASSKRMEEDPTSYLQDFYARFPTLKDRRPSLAIDLAEDQKKRGVESLL